MSNGLFGSVEELQKELPIIDVLDFFVIHSAIWPGVRMSQPVHWDRFQNSRQF